MPLLYPCTKSEIHIPLIFPQAIAECKMEAQMQLSRALMEAKAEKDNAVAQALAQAQAEKIDAIAEAKSSQLIKVIPRSHLQWRCRGILD